MKIKLGVLERIVLLNTLPVEGDLLTLKVIQEAKSKVAFSEKELKEFEIKRNPANPNEIKWDEKKDTGKIIELSDIVCQLVKDKLIKMNTEKKLHEQHISLYEKFVEK